MPLVLGLPAVGFGFGHWDKGLDLRAPAAFVAVLASWWCLSAGTLWLNAALDRDEGEVLMGPARPQGATTAAVPDGIERWAYAALALAVGLGAAAGPIPLACVATCAVLAVLYSHPATAWKGHPVLGPVTNVVGYGLLSPIAGWSIVRTEATPRTVVALILAAAWVSATYFGAQAFQGDEDRRRGYRTLVVSAGPAAVIGAARGLYAASFLGLAALAALGWFPRALLLAIPAWVALDRHLVAWGREPSPSASGGRAMLRRATALAVAVLVAVTAEHVWSSLRGRPPAGLGTAWP
jgi:4-hydroxybenzoate polyprenyltransferase